MSVVTLDSRRNSQQPFGRGVLIFALYKKLHRAVLTGGFRDVIKEIDGFDDRLVFSFAPYTHRWQGVRYWEWQRCTRCLQVNISSLRVILKGRRNCITQWERREYSRLYQHSRFANEAIVSRSTVFGWFWIKFSKTDLNETGIIINESDLRGIKQLRYLGWMPSGNSELRGETAWGIAAWMKWGPTTDRYINKGLKFKI